MIFPTIHLNGTSAESLIVGYMSAIRALDRAMNALNEAVPNGRDYYVQDSHNDGQSSINVALTEHSARYVKLREVWTELHAIVENLYAQRAS